MTNKEALKEVLMVSVSDLALDKALLDADITGNNTYAKENKGNIDLCAIEVLTWLLSTPDISEGDYSVSYDRKAVQSRLDLLNLKYNPTSVTKPKITGVRVW